MCSIPARVSKRFQTFLFCIVFVLPVQEQRCTADEKVWAFAVVTDPEPHVAPTGKDALAPFADDLRYLKQQFFPTTVPDDRPRPEFILVPGDIAPAEATDKAFREVLGEDVIWLPVPGNHDQSRIEAKKMSAILARFEKFGLQWGPAGPTGLQYHFTFRNALFVGLNIYWNGKPKPGSEVAGDGLTEEGLKWVRNVLADSKAQYKIVYAHRPAWPFGGRHDKDPLAEPEMRDRFWQALADGGCQLYLCGHTHSYGTYQWLGNRDPNRWQGYNSRIIPQPVSVWQIDAGSVRGRDSHYDRCVLYFRVTGKAIEVESHVWPKALGRSGHHAVLPNTDTTLYRFQILPCAKDNLAGKDPSRAATSQPAR